VTAQVAGEHFDRGLDRFGEMSLEDKVRFAANIGVAAVGPKVLPKVGGAARAVRGGEAGASVTDGELLIKGSKPVSKPVTCSFSATTTVATPAGAVAIATVKVGDTVTAADADTGRVADHTVTDVEVHTDREVEYLRIDGETIETTPNHRFLTDHGWAEAAALYPGTKVKQLDGTTGMVDGYSIEVRPVIMYDLTVSDVHTFAVGEGQWVVHNAGPCTSRPAGLRPDPNAEGPHVTFRRDGSTGKVSHYAEWAPQSNPLNPSPWELVKRVDMQGLPHFDKLTGTYIATPHAQGPWGVRPLEPWEWTRGY
jgi:hypothetical protein